MALRPAIFLDRDGTLNVPVVREGKPYPPQKIEGFQLLDGVIDGCRDLKQAGFLLVVVTNQPDVSRGTQSQEVVEAMHAKLKRLLPELDYIEVCYDAGQGNHDRRRKPEPGMLEDAALFLEIDLSASWMIGDRWRDVDCGKRAGVKTIFIDCGYEEELRMAPDFIVSSFFAATKAVLAHHVF